MTKAEIVEEIVGYHRQRQFAMELRKMVELKIGAHVRMMLGWRKDLPERERKDISARTAAMLKAEDGPYAHIIKSARMQRIKFEEDIERPAEKAMARLAKQLLVWERFGKDIRGFGEVSLAVIVAEAGDLDNYDSEAKLWKRMGLAPGQGSVPKGLKAEERKQAWIDRRYNPVRRSRMWNIGDTLIKGNRDGKYRMIYLARKEYELARNPEMTKMHAHRRAQHYMEKRLLRDLWRAWRRPNGSVSKQRPMCEWSAPTITEVTALAA